MPNIAAIDWLILLLYFFLVLTIASQLRQKSRTAAGFLHAGRELPAWICGLAMLAASLGATELIAMGAVGARYGLAAAVSVTLGSAPALVFLGLFMMPLVYASKARTAPEYLGLRFGSPTRLLAACLTAATSLAGAAIAFYAMARILQLLHIFDPLFYVLGWPRQAAFTLSILLPAAIVLAYVLLGSLTASVYNQVVQFIAIVAAFLPLAVLGLNNIGGWTGLAASPALNGWHSSAMASGAGQGLVPARVDPASSTPLADARGNPLPNYAMATPRMLMHLLPTGLLGLGLAALFASLMSGVAACVTAVFTVFTCDIYQPAIRPAATDPHLLAVARWAAVGAIVLPAGAALAVGGFRPAGLDGIFAALLLTFSLGNAPLLVTFLLAMFWKRATRRGAFAGLLAGFAAALLHHALTTPGLHAGWIAVLHRYSGIAAQCFGTAIFAFAANLIVTAAVSLSTRADPPLMKAIGKTAEPKPYAGFASGTTAG